MKLLLLALIQEIVDHPGIELSVIKRKYQLDDSKANHLIKQINQLLTEQGYFPVERKKKRLWLNLNHDSVNNLKKMIQGESLDHPQKNIRKNLIVLEIFIHKQTSLGFFANTYGVSKNTVMTDVNELKHTLALKEIQLLYSRKDGYYLSGAELEIKKILISNLHQLFNHNWNETMLGNYFNFLNKTVDCYQTKIFKAEKLLNTQFSNRQLKLLSILIPFIQHRSENYFVPEIIDIDSLATTKDYKRIESVLKETKISEGLAIQDQSFIILQFLSANVIRSKQGENKKLRDTIDQVVSFFEVHSVYAFNEREKLIEMLFQHLSPAIYRLKYGIPYEDQNIEKVVGQYSSIFPRVKEALKFIEDVYVIKFTEVEIIYVSLIFQSFLTKNEISSHKKRPQAIVVCENGVSVSNLLFQTISKIFPMIDFAANVSARDYYNNPLVYSDIKIIFSTMYLKTTKKLFVVSNLLDEEAKLRLIEKVNIELFDQRPRLNIEKIITLVKRNSAGLDEEQLRKELIKYLDTSEYEEYLFELGTKSNFNQLLSKEFIKYSKRQFSFNEAIQAVAEPLLKFGSIEQRFVDTILSRYDEKFPYFVIAPGIAIPHAGFSDGVKKIGLSYLQLENPIHFSKEHQVYGLLMIAPINNTHHQNAIQNFYKMVSNQQRRSQLLALKDAKAIKNFFKANVQ
ncbi:BglG family transcription antiterminator [Enterococcus sp. LJL120]